MTPICEPRIHREFVVSRAFDAPRALVYRAWTDPARLAAWWGPREFTNPICELDVRPGGPYRIVMRGPAGGDYPISGFFCEVVPPTRLVMTVDLSDHPDDWHDLVAPHREATEGRPILESLMTVTFAEDVGRTCLTVRTRFESAAILDGMLRIGMAEGWSESLDRLDSLLDSEHP